MLFFGKKKKDTDSPSNEKKAAKQMPRTKKVQFMPIKLSEITEMLDNYITVLVSLEPVNYYASKDQYLQCTFFFKEDYSEVYFSLEYIDRDFSKGSTPYYKADYELMKKVVMKFGQRI